MSWRPTLGAWLQGDGVDFRVWAPDHERVAVRVEQGGPTGPHPLRREQDGYFAGHVVGLRAGARYRYVLDDPDGDDAFPDPASRYQPEGVHGPSEVVDPAASRWSDREWRAVPLERLVIYELHLGTFTPAGTYGSAADALEEVVELGATAVQLMPVADFAGGRNWGYDAVDLFAPARCYGRPDGLRALVDRAHALGLAVILDVVYNHFGPDGACQGTYASQYFSDRHHTPWGAGINLDAAGSAAVRSYFIESALHWAYEYHVDGFRLDATATLRDDGPRHFLAEHAERVHEAGRELGRELLVIAEDHRNLATVIERPERDGWGCDAVIADDFHHVVRRIVAGDREGYYQDYDDSTADLARTIEQGWLYTGQRSPFWGEVRGTDPAGLPPPRFVHCIQNHDQVGNRAFGDRLHHQVSQSSYHAASTLLLCTAATPMLFMGQEWAASSPFQFFTDHHEALGHAVTRGRREEFRAWSAFSAPEARARIPDPQAPSTFERSKLDWAEREREPHASTLRLYQALLRLRRTEPALRWGPDATQRAVAVDADTVALYRQRGGAAVAVIARLRGDGGSAAVADDALTPPPGTRWEPVLSTEDVAYTAEPAVVRLDVSAGPPACGFHRPGAVVLHAVPTG